MPHTPDWHLLDNTFADANAGLALPTRQTALGSARLTIANLDRDDPPGYVPGGVPRDAAFNRNTFLISATPCMPAFDVTCAVDGFAPSTTPIQWRLVCRHVLCRHSNAGGARYSGACETFDREWRGESRSASFPLFRPDCSYTYNDDSRVLGGHALLIVAATLPGGTLCDYVHLRIGGSNPGQDDVFRYLDERLAGYDRNVVQMLRAIFRHESAFTQFAARPQSAAAMTFSRRHHTDPAQPDCRVRFDWPDDPPQFPLASFDFGVGISQFTRVAGQRISAEIAWDWRENIRRGTNLFLAKLRRRFEPNITWQHLALAAWASYNGTGAAADNYARQLAASDEGARVSFDPVPAAPLSAELAAAPPLSAPQPWVVA
jgi:hypothetical protein